VPSTTPAWIQRAENSWKHIQDSLHNAQKMLERSSNLIRQEFENIEQAGRHRMLVNPDMVRECEKDWIIGLVSEFNKGTLTFASLKQALEKNDHHVRPLMGEADAKVLSALIEEVDRAVLDRMISISTEHLKKAELELSLAKESRDFLNGYKTRVYEAYTAGLGPDLKEKWIGKYGSERSPERPEWIFANTTEPGASSSPQRRGSKKP
jgi:hypothetical protein